MSVHVVPCMSIRDRSRVSLRFVFVLLPVLVGVFVLASLPIHVSLCIGAYKANIVHYIRIISIRKMIFLLSVLVVDV